MGLLAIAASKARRLGLLPRVAASLSWVALVVALAGVAWMAVLPLDGQFRGTYISENALLPHQASTHYRETEWHILRGIRAQIREWQDLPLSERHAEMAHMLDDFALATSATDDTLYAVLHAPRGSHNEAIVLVAPWNVAGDSGSEFNDGGVSLLVGLARFFRRWSIWHKNLVFVFPNDSVALRKWVKEYHTDLQHTAGSVEGAVVLEFPSTGEHFDYVEVLYEGFNGQLPNLDLVNTAVKVAEGEWVRAEVGVAAGTGGAHNTYTRRLKALLQGVVELVVAGTGLKTSREPGSAMFSGWRIDAVTLRAKHTAEHGGQHDITTFGRLAEGLVRSINNLLEHFHQSFFFYLMMGPKYFVSIATYLPAALLVANSFPIMALYLVINHKPQPLAAWAKAGILLAVVWIATMLSAHIFVASQQLYVLFAPMLLVLLPQKGELPMHITTLVLLGLSLTTLAMLNFGLSILLGLVCVPLAWLRPGKTWSNALLLALSCPVTVLMVLGSLNNLSFGQIVNGLTLAHTQLNVWTSAVLVGVWYPAWLATAIAYF